MTDLRTAAQQALEALEQSETFVPYEGFGMARREAERKHQAAITALRAALAQQAEPVTWADALKDAFFEGFTSVATYNDTLLNSPEEAWENYKPPRTAPPQRKPLTNHDQHCVDVPGYGLMAVRLVRAVERAHGIKE